MIAILAIVAVFAIDIWLAVVMSTLWGWFIVPLGVVPIGFLHAYGLLLFKTFLFATVSDKGLVERIAEALALSTISLIFGWMIHITGLIIS